MDTQFLKNACLTPWNKFEIGVEGKVVSDSGLLCANHVYIDCPTPFLVAATSLDMPSGEEHFGIVLVTSQASIDEFIDGPYPPYNKPNMLPLAEIIGIRSDAFMEGQKKFSLLRKTVRSAAGLATLVPIIYGILFTSMGVSIRICASDDIPMSLQISW